ncbi:MAG: class I SAM-dependent RNA methyltransferase [Devosia sp.]
MTQITITALGQRGEGIAEIAGQRLYVPFTLPGEKVEIAMEGERGTLLSVLAPSPDRIEPVCGYFGVCGGCSLQHLAPAPYAAFKRGLVVTALSHAGIDVPVGQLVEARGIGRRRATLHTRAAGAGYMRPRSHDLLDIEACPILVPALQQSAPGIARALHAAVGDSDIGFTATATGLDVSVRNERKLKPQKLVPLAQNLKLARLSLNGELVLQSQPPSVRMGKALVELPSGSFLQTTEAAEAALAGLVLAGLKGARSVADLFCGVGPFALRIAESARVLAADSDRPAIAALQHAVKHTQGLKPITTLSRDLFRDPLAPAELAPFDAVVFDPPRAGAEAQARELVRSKVKTIVGVSCEPRTFARDAAILLAGGYRLESVTPLDQFAYSIHVELVGVFKR